ncbi:tetratricopeptide repeat protein [Albibacterium bauzanense]|uniref:Tetratricopeptide repeat protein n=1 Tax=Albibacterium bauzanense TaxID=653929 RepID=A0A4R1M0W4_9SPHI|nr:tetratricopeptide repeat protein [Albibacterium bauzanense]TCK83169.1 tetratricopeptide repeat protein [Albibacterium bauzanense]
MINTKQIIVIAGIVVLMGVILLQPVKSLTKEEPVATEDAMASATTDQFSLESVSQIAKQGLSANLTKEITDLETKLNAASDADKLPLYKELAQHWLDVNQPMPVAFIYEEIAQEEPSLENWVKTGDLFTDSYQHLSDTVMAPAFTERAKKAYESALAIDDKNLDARTGLGTALVNGPAPMAGITMLLDVVKEDPANLKANYNLGLFSMKSRQFDKAVERFNTVLEQTPNNAEVWFYLATSYENIGLKADAIKAFQKSKELAADPSLTQFIDRKVEELSK